MATETQSQKKGSLETPLQPPSRQKTISQPQQPHPKKRPKPQPSKGPSKPKRTRSQQKEEELLSIGQSPLPNLSPEELKTRNNNFAHIAHLRESMKTGVEKWDEEIKKEKEMNRKLWLEAQRERLARWLEDAETVFSFAKTTATYIPTIKEEWRKALQLKPSTTLGDPGKPPGKPSKLIDPTPVRKHTAKKSGSGRQRSASKASSLEGDPQKGLSKPSQTEDLGDQTGEPVEEPNEDPKTPLGTTPKGTTPPGKHQRYNTPRYNTKRYNTTRYTT